MVFGDKIDPNIYADVAESIAKAIGDHKNAVKAAQARRFYDEVVMWEEKIRQNPASFAENLPLIKMMKAKVAYAKGRKHIDAGFERMMNTGLNQVACPKTLTQFKTFFEAFMGFYKVYGPK
ncbi:MAG: type III-A CRISPR-associated protein Csm2 [Gammaproteobacteria bacterium]|nr:type III-A CRISPR-associated protein Csm2 [Gammaproteobacteria bacterium]